jgi:hypothetical protein
LPFVVALAEIGEHFCVGFIFEEIKAKNPISVGIIASGGIGGLSTLIKYWLGLLLTIFIMFRVVTMMFNAWAETRPDANVIPNPPPPQASRPRPDIPHEKKTFIDKGITAIARFLAAQTTKKNQATFRSMDASEYDSKEQKFQEEESEGKSKKPDKKKKKKKNE